MSNINTDIIAFINDYWGNLDRFEIDSQTTLSDLGFYGDDKLEFLYAFFEWFSIDSTNFNERLYIEKEQGFFLMTLLNFFAKRKKSNEVKEITLGDLTKVAKDKRWNINN